MIIKERPLENVVSIETEKAEYNNIVKIEQATFDGLEGMPFLLMTHENGETNAIRPRDVKSIEFGEKESKIKTQKDVLDAWGEGCLVEI